MHTVVKISSEEALALVQHSVTEANLIHRQIAIAVAGPEGELLAFLRMDGASPAAAQIAQNKAYTSARDRKDTREMGIFMRDQQREAAYWGDSGITGFGGGAAVVHQGNVIGGIGISGLSEDEDERIAKAAIQKVYVV